MIRAQLADGRILEFPEGTDQAVIDKVVKQETIPGRVPTQPERAIAPIPEGGTPPMSAIGGTPPMPTFGANVIGEVPQVGGGIVGGVVTAPLAVKAGVAGTAIGGPVVGGLAALGTTALGVAFGAGTGEAYKQVGQQLSGSLDAPKTSIEAAKRIGKAGVTEGAWDLVGGLAMKGFGKIIAPFKNKVMGETEGVINLLKDRIKPVVLLPAEATESRVLDLLQNVSESSIVGGGAIQTYKTQRLKFFDDFADSLIDEFGKRTDPTDLGNLFVASISNSRAVHAKASSILYNSVKAGRTKTTTQSLKNFAKPLQRRAGKLEGIEAKNAGDDLVSAVMDLPEQLSYKEATELRSRLISRINEFSVINKKAPAIGKAKKMVGLLDKAIGKSLGEIGAPTGQAAIRRGAVLSEGLDHSIADAVDVFNSNGIPTKWSHSGMVDEHKGMYPKIAEKFGTTPEGLPKLGHWGGTSPDFYTSYISAEKSVLPKNWKKIAKKHKIDYVETPKRVVDPKKTNPPEVEFQIKTEGMKEEELSSKWTDFAEDMVTGKSLKGKAGIPPTGSTPLEAWRAANRFYRDGQKKFNSTLIRRLVKFADDTGTGAEMIGSAIFKPRHISSVQRVKNALKDDPATWKKMQGFFMQHILQKSTDVDGNIVGKRIINAISGKPNSFGMPMLKEVFSEKQIDSLVTFGKAVKLTQKRQAEGAGKVLIQLTQAGAMGALFTGNLELPAATIIIGPAVVSKMLLNPRVAELLTTGLTLPARAPEAAGVMTRLIAATWRAREGEDETVK